MGYQVAHAGLDGAGMDGAVRFAGHDGQGKDISLGPVKECLALVGWQGGDFGVDLQPDGFLGMLGGLPLLYDGLLSFSFCLLASVSGRDVSKVGGTGILRCRREI